MQKAREHLREMWDELTVSCSEDTGTLIGLPHPYVVPSIIKSNGMAFEEMYYWDNLFIVAGLIASGRVELAKSIVENQVYLIQRFGMVPNASRFYMLSRTQPPTLTMQIFLVYHETEDVEWLRRTMRVAVEEYERIWLSKHHPHHHNVYEGLSRYYDINLLHSLAEASSGWDYTPRFDQRCLDFVPIDLNAFLWRYEQDIADAADILGKNDAHHWRAAAKQRKKTIDEYMWNEKEGLYFDYDYVNGKQSRHSSLAAYVPLFVGMCDHDKAAELEQTLDRFETPFGVSASAIDEGEFEMRQWASPNGWAPLHYFVVHGLKHYGFEVHAQQVAEKWMKSNLYWFEREGKFFEKYNVIDISEPAGEGVYPLQEGFAWTNAVFEVFARDYSSS